MKTRLAFTLLLLVASVACFGQQNTQWEKWNWLMGEWTGEGGGQPGQGSGTFSFSFDLGEKIIVRKSHSEYPATDNKPAVVHDDLMIIYLDLDENPTKAIYFDNEGHVIDYSISYGNKSVTLTSKKMQGAPVFRLTYTLLEDEKINTKFEMSQDGENFMTYVEGKSKRTK